MVRVGLRVGVRDRASVGSGLLGLGGSKDLISCQVYNMRTGRIDRPPI